MKKRQLLAFVLVCMMLVAVFPLTASAYYYEPATVYVNDTRISGIDAYMDNNGNIRVSSHEDILKIFPNELKNIIIVYNPQEGILVEEYANDFGYNCFQRNTTLYISTKSNGNYYPTYPPFYQQKVEVFVNGLRVATDSVYCQDDQFYFNRNGDLTTIFPESVDKPYSFSWQNTRLETLANYYQYSYVYSDRRIYLNNDGNSPVEVLLNEKIVDFPDQQPVVLRPGRTMVPIRTIAELVNCSVEWNQEHEFATITKGRNTLRIWKNSSSYWHNGKYYEMDVAAQVINGRTMVPLRFIAEAFGYEVDYSTDGIFKVTLQTIYTVQ